MCKLYGTGGKKHSHTEHGKTLVSKPNKKTQNMKTGKELAQLTTLFWLYVLQTLSKIAMTG